MKTLTLLLAFGLIGCASKPPLGDDRYQAFANDWAVIQWCGEAGSMEPGLAASAHAQMARELHCFTYDEVQLKAAVSSPSVRRSQVSRDTCNGFSMKFAGLQQTNQGRVNTYEVPTYMPKQTICNRIGTQTFCSTY